MFTDAVKAYKNALENDPYMWCAYRRLVEIDPISTDPSQYFSESNPKIFDCLSKLDMYGSERKSVKNAIFTPFSDKKDLNSSVCSIDNEKKSLGKMIKQFKTPNSRNDDVEARLQMTTEKVRGFAVSNVFSAFNKVQPVADDTKENASVNPFDLESNDPSIFSSGVINRQKILSQSRQT